MLTRHAMLAVCVSLALACSTKDHVASSTAIRDSLNSAVARRSGEVRADQVAPGTWTDVLIFGPYSPDELVRRCVGRSVDTRGISSRDDVDLLVFRFADGHMISRAVRRGDPAIGPEAWNARYTHGATFRLVSDGAATGRTTRIVPLVGRAPACE
jgi:hypothetical protein